MLHLGDDYATATTSGRRMPHRIETLVAVLSMALDCCMHWMGLRVSQYMDCTWMWIDQPCFHKWAAYFAMGLCCVVDGRGLNKAC